MPPPLKLGFFIQPVHPPSRPYADALREDGTLDELQQKWLSDTVDVPVLK